MPDHEYNNNVVLVLLNSGELSKQPFNEPH